MFNTLNGAMAKTSTHLQQDKEVNQVYKTNDYSKFNTMKGNRKLNKLHLKRLIDSVKKHDLLYANPILVNEKYEIIDGQHRFNVCCELKKPIHYTKVNGMGLQEVQILNANSKNWKSEDYVNGYCDLNMKEYIWLREFCIKNNLSAEIAAILCNGSNKYAEIIKSGNFIAKDKSAAYKMAAYFKLYLEYYNGAKRRRFVEALISLNKVKGFSHDKMLSKLKYQSAKLKDCVTIKTYLAILEEIYNYKERGEKLRFF